MKSKVLLVAILSTLSLSAWATPPSGTNCNGNGSCGQTTNTTNNTTNQGGTGGVGYGGTGGSALATGGNSSSVSNGGSVNSDIRNTNTNLNTNTNANSNVGVNTSSNVQGQIQGQGQKQSTSNSNNSTLVVEGDNFEAKRIPVNTAYAPSIAPTANCALSVSGGFSTIAFSGSFGKAYIDENCSKLEAVRSVALVLKDTATAEAMMCQDKAYAKARLTAGRACPVEQE